MNLTELFQTSSIIAVIGCSDKAGRAGHDIPHMLKNNGFTIIPVNPTLEQALGQPAYSTMNEIGDDIQIDIVVIFRNPKYSAEAVAEAVNWAQKNNQKPVIWTQPGVSTSEARKSAESAGFTYIEDSCISVEYAKYGRR